MSDEIYYQMKCTYDKHVFLFPLLWRPRFPVTPELWKKGKVSAKPGWTKKHDLWPEC